ncbi:hypothetical protein JCM11491_004608 [Sporobolomyces phaffii]
MFHKKKPPAPLRPVKREPAVAAPTLARSSPAPSTSTSTSTAPGSPAAAAGGTYTDFILRASSSDAASWKHHVMKFTAAGPADRVVDPADPQAFVRPVRLNRKDPRTVRRLTDQDRERFNQRALLNSAQAGVDPMQLDGGGDNNQNDPDSKPDVVKDEQGDDDGDAKRDKEQLDPTLVGRGTSGLVSGSRARGPGGMFKKKTRRVFVASEESRRLKREEWQPWVLEDDDGHERWIGRLEGGAGEVDLQGGKSQQQANGKASLKGWRPAANASDAGGGGSSYVAFVFGDNGDEFQVVPINRWYKFNQGPKYLTLAEEEAEEEWNRQQKTKETERWVMHKRVAPIPNPNAGSTESSAAASTSTAPTLTRTTTTAATSSRPPGGRGGNLRDRMIARSAVGIKVDDDDADDHGKPRLKAVISATTGTGGGARAAARGRGGGGDQDDDEFDYEEDFQDDEEGIAKIDDLADEDETKELEERIRKEMRGAERPDEIPDDVDRDDDDELTGTGREIKKLVKKTDKSGAYESDDEENPYASSDEEDDNASVTSADARAGGGGPASSRQTSPQPLASGSGRAQSPSSAHSHSRHHSPSSRAGTPVSGSGSALLAKRATSPSGRSAATSRTSSPGPSSLSSSSKRKRGEGGGAAGGVESADGSGDGSKRRKSGTDGGGLIAKEDLVAFLKSRPNHSSTTKDVLVHFRRQLKLEPKNKSAISKLVKAVADLVNGNLVLKAGL